MEKKDEILGRNAIQWITKATGVPASNLFMQWILCTNSSGFKVMIKEKSKETFYEVTYRGDGSGYDIVIFERKDTIHVNQ